MSKFKVGDRPWLPHTGKISISRVCPICAGTKQVELILGTGEHVLLPCEYCGNGYLGPRGWVNEYEFVSGIEQLTITEIHVTQTEDGEAAEYYFTGHRVAKETETFATEEEARVACAEVVKRITEEESTRAEYIKHNQNKNYSWNAGYHLREAKREEENAARHRQRAILCKAKAKVEGLESAKEEEK